MNRRGQENIATEARKPAYKIWLIAIGVILLIVVLYFIGSRVVGKAITFTPPSAEFAAGSVYPVPVPLHEGDTITISLGAVIPAGVEWVDYEVELGYNPLIVEFIEPPVGSANSLLVDDWGGPSDAVLYDLTILSGVTGSEIILRHGGLTPPIPSTGSVRLASFTFRVLPSQEVTADNIGGVFRVDRVSVYDISTDQDIFAWLPAAGGFTQVEPGFACPTSTDLCTPMECTRLRSCPAAPPADCTGLIDPAACPPVKDDTSGSAWFDNLNGADVAPVVLQTELCRANGIEAAACIPQALFSADLNKDGKVNGQDAYLILKSAEAKVRGECGDAAQAPCAFGKTLVCDDGSFRVEGYKGYLPNPAHQCSDFATGMNDYLATAGVS